jgi:hypothetical protein
MSISLRTLVAVVAVSLFGAHAQAQWTSGPALGAAGSNSTGYSMPPTVSMPAVPTFTSSAPTAVEELPAPSYVAPNAPTATAAPPTGAGPVMQPYMPATIQPPTSYAPVAGGPIATPMPGGPAIAPPITSQGPAGYTLPQYAAPQNSGSQYGVPQYGSAQYGSIPSGPYNTPSVAQLPLGQPPYTPGSTSAALANPYAGQEMPMGNLARQEISPYAKPQSPPSQSTWVPTKVASLMPRSWTGNGAVEAPAPMQPSYGAYGAYGGGGGACDPNACYGPPPTVCCPPENWCDNIGVLTSYTAFKNGIDLDGQNANFGTRYGVFGAAPLLREWGIGAQGGSTVGWSDWKGSQYTGDDTRFQNFITAGVFQRPCGSGFGWAIVHDWLRDDFYADMQFTQFRVAGSYQFTPGSEIGIWAALPQGRDETFVGTPAVLNRFQTLLQGNLYWQQAWSDWAWSNVFIGMAESPSDITYGSNVQVALTSFVAITGSAAYVLPGSGGNDGYQEEIWNLSLGLTFYPGSAMRNARSQFRPFLPMADNGNMAIWRK